MVTMPVDKGFYVTSGFGQRGGQYAGMHWGVDFGRNGGSGGHPVYAVKDGTIARVGPASGFGQWLGVDHPASNGGGEVIYGHVIPEVRLGQSVKEGQRIGRINPDSKTNGGVAPHAHVEWHRYTWVPPGPGRLDPMTMLKGAKWPGESAPDPAPASKPQGGNMNDAFDIDWSSRFWEHGSAAKSICVLHTTENSASTRAEAVAQYQIDSQSGSYHVLVDTTGRALRENSDDQKTWSSGNYGNTVGLHLSFVAQARWSRNEWLAQEAMLRRAARVVAFWCKKHNIPAKFISGEQVRAGVRGMTDHNGTRIAWGVTDHTDVGKGFPFDVFERYVNEVIKGTVPAPKEEDDMFSDNDRRMLDRVHRELTQLYPSRSKYRVDDRNVDTLAGMLLNAEGRIHEAFVQDMAKSLGKTPDQVAQALRDAVKAGK